MNPDRQQAIDYLRGPANGLWRWAENGSVLVWRDGSTIAFREEIVQILQWLAPNGLPSFGALVFLLAACRGKVPRANEIVLESPRPLPANMGKDAAVLVFQWKQLHAQLEATLTQLARASQLPSELNTGIKARCVLAEAVFEPAKAERYVGADAILRGLSEPINDTDLLGEERWEWNGGYIHQLHIVAEGLKLQTYESLTLRLRTGLDSLPKEIDAALPTAERARRLIEELSRDREFGAVARAARELMAAVRLPRRLGEREQLAIGGVADITNRGPLDRLLLSELAHDDLTLAVRVALNEALYLRREPPMREPPGTLALLLDSGVRLWGVPRVLATAVALALIARYKQHSEVLAWRARGKQLLPVDLLARAGLVQHLGALETDAHPGDSLPAFAGAVASGVQNQSVLITHRDTLDDPEFRRALADHPTAPGFIAVVDRAGHFELHALPLARRPPVCEADLDLDSVFEGKTGVPPIKVEMDPSLPAIFGVHPFPFLLPLAGKVDCSTKADDGFTYAVLNDRRLVRFRDQRTGAHVFASDLPGGRTIWMDCVAAVVHVVKSAASQRPARLCSLPLADPQLRVMDLVTGEEIRAVFRCGEVILVIRDADVRAHGLSDGRFLGRILNPHRWLIGRFFRGQSHFYFAAWDGLSVKLEPVTLPKDCWFKEVVAIFDREGLEGPWVLQTSGELISTASDEKVKLTMPTGPMNGYTLTVARDGHRVHVSVQAIEWDCLYDLKTGESTNAPKLRAPAKTLDASPPLPVWNLFRVAESIARLNDGVAICGLKKRWRMLTLNGRNQLNIGELPAHEQSQLLNQIHFTTRLKPNQLGCLLQLAEWPGGSKAYLDSRGLLHLKSHDPTVPEISLVLSDGEVAGWTSDGHVCGPQFFFEGVYHSEPERVYESIVKFLCRL
jgi:hypothetical protein